MQLCVELIPFEADFAAAVKPDVLLDCMLSVREGPQLLEVWLAAGLDMCKICDVEHIEAREYDRIGGMIVSSVSRVGVA